MNEWSVLAWFGQANYHVMDWANSWYWPCFWLMFFMGCLIGMTPLKSHHEHTFIQVVFIWIRRAILWFGFCLVCLPFIMLYVYDMTAGNQLADSGQAVRTWFWLLTKEQGFGVLPAAILGWFSRILFHRYIEPMWSAMLKKLRHQQSDESASDIRSEHGKFVAKDFSPAKHYAYAKGKILIGLDAREKPIYVPLDTWRETNTQLIGPTRYGKGVIIGCLADQAIRMGDACIYIDPKNDKFVPHIMHAAAKAAGKPFYYVALHDNGVGSWAPFAGGSERDALSRVETAFGLQLTGDPGTDFYKTQEKQLLAKHFKETRNILSLAKLLEHSDANKLKAQLDSWSHIKSLCPKKGGFSLAKALKEGAVVYVQGGLTDEVIKTATKVFIIEVIQEAMRLDKDRPHHLTLIVDEVRFLVSKQLADALATVVGFRVNIVTAYQSMKDIEQPDDATLNGKSLAQSININSQVKAIYGGADFETAEYAANLSGVIQKEVTKFEGTEIRASGGEIWNQKRMVGAQEENLINTNMVLSLPPRVCVFVQPRHLVDIAFTSFVPVKDPEALDNFLSGKASPTRDAASKAPSPTPKDETPLEVEPIQAKNAPPTDSNSHLDDFAKSIAEKVESNVSQAKPTTSDAQVPQKKEKKTKADAPVSQAKPAAGAEKKKRRKKKTTPDPVVSAATLDAITGYLAGSDHADESSVSAKDAPKPHKVEASTIQSDDNTEAPSEPPQKEEPFLGLDLSKLEVRDDNEALKALSDDTEES